MTIPISISVLCPYVTIEKFSEISGMPTATVKLKIQNGEIPIRQKTKKREKVLINMIELTKDALNI